MNWKIESGKKGGRQEKTQHCKKRRNPTLKRQKGAHCDIWAAFALKMRQRATAAPKLLQALKSWKLALKLARLCKRAKLFVWVSVFVFLKAFILKAFKNSRLIYFKCVFLSRKRLLKLLDNFLNLEKGKLLGIFLKAFFRLSFYCGIRERNF